MDIGIYSDNISNSLSSRELPRELSQGGTSRSSLTDNIHTVTDCHSELTTNKMTGAISTTTTVRPQLVPFKLTMGRIVGNSDDEDPLQAFILNPRNPAKAAGLYVAIACKDLPLSFRELLLDWRSEQVRNLLGIICKDILPEDRRRFNNICSGFKRAPNNRYEQMIFAPDISFLLHKYGKIALYRQVEFYTDCCRRAWHYYHPGGTTNANDIDIFTADAEHCFKKLYQPIHELTKPKQEWMEIIANGIYFRDYCSVLGSTIKLNSIAPCSVTPLTETFDSVFLSTTGESRPSYHSGDNETDNMDGVHSQSFLQRLVNICCCGV